MASLTDMGMAKAIRDAKSSGKDVWLTDQGSARGIGRLRFRASPGGQTLFYFRYTDPTGKRIPLPIGAYDQKGAAGLTLKAARAKAGDLSKLYQGTAGTGSGKRDLRAHLDHEAAEETARIETAASDRVEAERQAIAGSLQKLMDGYVAHLVRQRKGSAQDARNIFKRNVTVEFPDLAVTRATELANKDISAILAKLIDRGAGRTAAKLRAYLRAAFSCALSAESDPTIHPDLHNFNLTANPAAAVTAKNLSAFNKPRERVLNEVEMRGFLAALDKQTGIARDAVLLSLYLGGQRSAQLVRLKPADVDLEASTLTLYDGKGNRQQPRVHMLPLTQRAADVVRRLIEVNGDKAYLISLAPRGKNADGAVHVRTETLSEVVTTISAQMVADKTARSPFEHRDLRRTAETMLASIGVSKDVRAQVLSHGLSGVQQRHYDRHDYMDEKRHALQAWDSKLAEIESGTKPANVLPIKRAAR